MWWARLVVAGSLAVCAAFVAASPASAHEPNTTAIELRQTSDSVTAQVDVPLDALQSVLQTTIATDRLSLATKRDVISGYVTEHLAFSDPAGGVWREAVGTLTAITVNDISLLRVIVAASPAGGLPASYAITYDGIVESDATHEVYVTLSGSGEGSRLVGVLDNQVRVLTVDESAAESAVSAADATSDLISMIGRGFHHVLGGADHLLFLLVLLLVAPVAAVGRRWSASVGAQLALVDIVKIATAFTIGHSITLAASAFEWLKVPSQPVEILVAASVGVAALHALRPLTARAEVWIAGGFGLIHGLAFSTLLRDLALGQSTSMVSLLGFNIGVELAQVVVIALAFPALWSLSRTRSYLFLRTGGAIAALVFATAWIVERLGWAVSPFAGVEQAIISHLWVGAVVALGIVGFGLAGRPVARLSRFRRMAGIHTHDGHAEGALQIAFAMLTLPKRTAPVDHDHVRIGTDRN